MKSIFEYQANFQFIKCDNKYMKK